VLLFRPRPQHHQCRGRWLASQTLWFCLAQIPPSEPKPAALKVAQAAAYIGVSSQYFNKHRHLDRKRIRAGLDPEGPRWLELGDKTRPNIRYLRSELDAFLAGQSAETEARLSPGAESQRATAA